MLLLFLDHQRGNIMNIQSVLNLTSMPMASPSYPKGPYRFIDREYFIVVYESDPEAIRAAVPEPLEPDGSNTVLCEFMSLPDSAGFGSYSECGIVIPCKYNGENVNFTAQMYLDCEPPISGGREVWGFPKKYASPSLKTIQDTLTGKLEYAQHLVALGTMGYKHENLIENNKASQAHNIDEMEKIASKTQVNLKLIPGVDGNLSIAQLVAYNLEDIKIKGAWQGPARLHLVAHVNAPIADLPVLKVLKGIHFIADITLPYGRVLYDYLKGA